MRALYVGQLGEGETCLERCKVLANFNWECIGFDTLPYLRVEGRIRRALQHRLLDGPDVRRFNQDLLRFVRENRNVDVVWIDKGRWLFYSTLLEIKRLTNAILVHYTPDPAFTVHTSRHFMQSLPLYDLCITTKRYELESYRRHGAREVIFTLQGIDSRFEECEPCGDLNSEERQGAVFIGHCEPHYVRTLSALAENGVPLRIWGGGWEKLKKGTSPLRDCIQGGPVLGMSYPIALSQGEIGIGLLSKYSPDAFTTRTFEMPAAGLLLLAERTDEHLSLFEEGVEADFYSNTDELVEKAWHYLENEEKRVQLAARGRDKVLNEYTWSRVLTPAIELIENMIGGRLKILSH